MLCEHICYLFLVPQNPLFVYVHKRLTCMMLPLTTSIYVIELVFDFERNGGDVTTTTWHVLEECRMGLSKGFVE